MSPLHAPRTCTRGHAFIGNDPCPQCWPGYRTFTLKAKLWLYNGEAAWHFLTLPEKESKQIQERFSVVKRGWGSVRVRITIGETSWNTSIFPDKKAGAYVLPVKAEVRKKENLTVGKIIIFTMDVQDM